MDIATGINEIADEWEKKLKKIPFEDANERYRAFLWGEGPSQNMNSWSFGSEKRRNYSRDASTVDRGEK